MTRFITFYGAHTIQIQNARTTINLLLLLAPSQHVTEIGGELCELCKSKGEGMGEGAWLNSFY